MRNAWLALLVGCGRIDFDATRVDDANDAMRDDDSIASQPFTCDGIFTPIATPVGADSDLAVGVAQDSFAIGFIDRTGGMPYLAELGAQNQVLGTPSAILSVNGTSFASLTASSDTFFIEITAGTAHTILRTQANITSPMPYDTGTGITARDCIVADLPATRHVGLIADGTTLYAAYAQGSAFGTQVMNDFGVAITSMHCNPGTDHVHAIVETADGDCTGVKVDIPQPTSPTFGTISGEASDCHEPRYGIVDTVLDTGVLVWRRGDNRITTRYVDGMSRPEVDVTANGTSPRVASDGTNLWYVWTEAAQLHVGHRLPTDTSVSTRVLDGVDFAGSESYELVRAGDKVFLAALGANPAGLSVYRLCP